ncbi:MAG: hypothetical protein ABSB73_12135 [Solirubrobacteraceae bacterium]|jgi:hypothetical protein
MDESAQPSRRVTLLRLLAAALAGAIGAFGVPAGVHASQQAAASAATLPPAVSSDAKPD